MTLIDVFVVFLILNAVAIAAITDEDSRSTTFRGVSLPSVIDAKDLYQAYQDIQEEYHSKLQGEDNEWKILNNRQGVEVSLLQHPADPTCPYVKMTAIMPASPQECWDFLQLDQWETTMPLMDPFYEGVDTYGDYFFEGMNMTVARKRTKRILGILGKRDFVFVSVGHKGENEVFMSGTISVVTKSIPRQRDYTRAFQDSIAFYRPHDKNQTHLTIICRLDLNDSHGDGGYMPMWLYVKTIGTTASRSILNLRRELQRLSETKM
mmetsp:Transcript_19509/g.29349  ORF Transcript_19509/g.29349 Transcript_19509/m.29349 type:complete len:264 (+) Transcript_19509:193-984(+)|eukprot:CAMPEP_0178930964 /NCGR_PEP_ID=MMETSP0786-20121207/21621_1 /TAXON_ID=186022 /ORGANISM="Thalassionema frauenfeldii, Strain CCMP 1798" /LENGTH=263 /DNA_ID=CAMNT_0020607737 /DNA_START=143 /DNA_END=934 /DNA_ORIENTATION=-